MARLLVPADHAGSPQIENRHPADICRRPGFAYQAENARPLTQPTTEPTPYSAI
jgi:hypothetical protein